MQQIEFTVPAWVIPVIANDDKTGINEHEETCLNAFFDYVQKSHGPGYWVAGEEIATFAYNDVDAYLGKTWSAFYLLSPSKKDTMQINDSFEHKKSCTKWVITAKEGNTCVLWRDGIVDNDNPGKMMVLTAGQIKQHFSPLK